KSRHRGRIDGPESSRTHHPRPEESPSEWQKSEPEAARGFAGRSPAKPRAASDSRPHGPATARPTPSPVSASTLFSRSPRPPPAHPLRGQNTGDANPPHPLPPPPRAGEGRRPGGRPAPPRGGIAGRFPRNPPPTAPERGKAGFFPPPPAAGPPAPDRRATALP